MHGSRWLPAALLALIHFSTILANRTQHDRKKQPNIIFILTDDQDLHMSSLDYMPHLQTHITNQGTTFTNHYCTVALCCPSRVSLWTGKAAHNTNVTDINPPYGGYPKFVSQGLNDAYLPIWMQEGGYNTFYVGKLFNAQRVDNYASPRAKGWTGSEFLLDPYTYEYLNATFTRNGGEPVSYEGQYSTDVLKEKSLNFLDDALYAYREDETPFFLTIAPIAPHSNVHMNTAIDGNFSEGSNTQSPPVAAERHAHLFPEAKVPRTPHFNPEANPQSVSWIGRLPRQNQSNIDFNDHFYRQRLRTLQAVDEMIDELFSKLTSSGILEETYIFFSTDNGYHIGQHRLQPGKQCAFEEDVNIPFIVRGPGIAKNVTTDIVTTHTDLAPTFLSLAGIGLRDDFDGRAIPLLSSTTGEESEDWTTEHINIESWGVIMSEGDHGQILYPNHTYKALRIIAPGYSWLYTVWCLGEHELYDLVQDPWEMENLLGEGNDGQKEMSMGKRRQRANGPEQARLDDWAVYTADQIPMAAVRTDGGDEKDDSPSDSAERTTTSTLTHLLPRLDALLMVLKSCKGRACTHPWEILHPSPKDRVKSLLEAMHPKYDTFYAKQAKVAFERCEKGYIKESEGEMEVRPYSFDAGA